MVVHVATQLVGLDEIVPVTRSIVERVVWCTVATVGPDGAPRCRLMHPVWDWTGERPTAVVTARPTPLKVQHLAAQPTVSCHYWDPAHDTVAIDATARWLNDRERAEAWRRVAMIPEPVGFDPAMIWPDGPDSPDCAMLELVAHRVVTTEAGRPGHRWRADVAG